MASGGDSERRLLEASDEDDEGGTSLRVFSAFFFATGNDGFWLEARRRRRSPFTAEAAEVSSEEGIVRVTSSCEWEENS